jgi:short-subunit dehydrogenase
MELGGETRALITGASRGIGRAISQALDARGVRLGLVARELAGLEELAATLDGDPVLLAADVSSREEIEGAVAEFVERAGALELLVANAGLAHYGPFADMPAEFAEEMVRVNALGTVLTVKAGLDPMLDRGRGHIVVISSGAALRSFPGAAVYGGTKAANAGFAEALRHELSGTGVDVTTVFPGEVDTDLHAHQPDRLPDWRNGEDAIAPERVAAETLAAVEAGERAVYVPGAVRMLGLNGIAPRFVDRLLRRMRGPTAAPRRD